MIPVANTVVDPRTMVVHFLDAMATLSAVMRSGRLIALTGLAVLEEVLVVLHLRRPSLGQVSGPLEHGANVVEAGQAGEDHEAKHVSESTPGAVGWPPHCVAVNRG